MLEIEKSVVRSEIEGTLNVKQTIRAGDFLTAGSELAIVIPADKTLYKIDISMPEKEISGINVGDRIKYHFDALPFREYGELQGEIVKN